MFGYTTQEVLGQPYPLVPTERQAEFLDFLIRVDGGEFHQGVETVRRRKDGTLIDVRFSGGIIQGADHPNSEIFFSVEDITEQKRAERVLRASEAKFRGFLNAGPDATLIHNEAGEIMLASPRVEALFGYKPNELLGQPLGILIPERFRKRHAGHMQAYLQAPVARAMSGNLELLGRRRDGSEFPTEITLSPYRDEDGLFTIASVRDVTERLQLQEELRQAQKMEVIGQLTGGISHDFNNLLTIIQTNIELLEWNSESLCDDVRESIAAIRRATDRAALLTQRLLAYSRKQILKPSEHKIDKMILELSDLLGRTLGGRVITQVRLGAGDASIYIDGNQFDNAIINLAVNARDAMPTGGTLTIKTSVIIVEKGYALDRPGLEVGPHILVTVSDIGTGMAAETMRRAFEPFYTTKPTGQGTGLGLSQVYGFVKQSNGYIEIESEPEHGSTILIYLPQYFQTEGSAAKLANLAIETPDVGYGRQSVDTPGREVFDQHG